MRGICYVESGNYQQSLNDLSKAIELNPKDAWIFYSARGISYYLSGDYQRAINDFNKAIELSPEDADAYGLRGIAYARLGNNQEAIKDSNKVIELNPNDTGNYYNVACMYSVLNMPDKACEYLRTSIEKGYKDWDGITKDKDFDNIRAVDCYKAIMKDKK